MNNYDNNISSPTMKKQEMEASIFTLLKQYYLRIFSQQIKNFMIKSINSTLLVKKEADPVPVRFLPLFSIFFKISFFFFSLILSVEL